MNLYNSLTRKIEEFTPLNPPHVGMYSCGMTVYDYTHIGHGRKYVMDDVLRRTLTLNGYEVKHVQNVTDVGHLTSDADEGEDKLEKGAAKADKSVWDVASFFTDHFYSSMDKLNILRPHIICKATDHINDQISLIEKLFSTGFAYDTPEAVYYDVSRFKGYKDLFSQSDEKKVAARDEVRTGSHKKNPADFTLWFKLVDRFQAHVMHWPSPWGEGFPGWHLECSAMSMKYLGEQFDIHTGGEDHLFPHHPNEIAQSEGATGKKPFVRFWVHNAFLMVDGLKMSKSLGNTYTVDDIEAKDFNPLALRYLYLNAHYRRHQNFTWESLTSAQNAYQSLLSIMSNLRSPAEGQRTRLSEEKLTKLDSLRDRFILALNNDLNTPEALGVMWETLKSNIPSVDKLDLVYYFDEVLGLKLAGLPSKIQKEIPQFILKLKMERDNLRRDGKFDEADVLRQKIESEGYLVNDTPTGSQITSK